MFFRTFRRGAEPQEARRTAASRAAAIESEVTYTMNPGELSEELREDNAPDLRRRRVVTALSLFNIAAMGVITLYQTGIIGHLPEPPLPGFDTEKVNGSPEAYSIFGTPDAPLGLASYAVTLGLAAAGASDRAETTPALPIALAAKAGADALAAAKLTYDQGAKHKAFCVYCLLSAAATFAVVPLALPEAKKALGYWKRRRADSDAE